MDLFCELPFHPENEKSRTGTIPKTTETIKRDPQNEEKKDLQQKEIPVCIGPIIMVQNEDNRPRNRRGRGGRGGGARNFNNNQRFNQEYKMLLRFEKISGYIYNRVPFDCPICLTNCPRAKGVVVRECLHTFCKVCLKNAIDHCDEAEVKCPQFQCEGFIQQQEIRGLLPKQAYQKYLTKSIRLVEQKTENSFHCKTPNCPEWWILDDDDDGDFRCLTCRKTNCFKCQVIHFPLSCHQYRQRNYNRQSQQVLENLLVQGKAMRCSKCKIIVEKTEGCDGITCTVCNTDLCWATKGARWGPRGEGDLSGGCRCGVNGIKCHPDCQNCH